VTASEICALLTPGQAGELLDEIVFERLLEVIDLEGLRDLAGWLALEIGAVEAIPRARAGELSRALLDRAWQRFADDPWQHVRPSTLTHAEEAA
jgi:hypothetical protein